jgi:hypothetical protein
MRVMVVHGKGIQETIEEGGGICSGEDRRNSRRLRKSLLWEGWGESIKKKVKGLDIVGKRESIPCGSLGRLGQWSAFFQSPDLIKIPDISPPSHHQSVLNSTLNSMI